MSDRFVGQSDRTLARWTRDGVLLTDGAAWACYSRIRAGAVEYLQGSATVDNDTWNSTLHEFTLALVADGFERFFVWPLSAADYFVTEQARHSIYGLSSDVNTFTVNEFNLEYLLKAIKAKTDLLGVGMNVSVVSPVTADGLKIYLIHGDDYFLADGRALEFTNPDGDWQDLSGAVTVKLSIRPLQSTVALISKTGTVVTPTGIQKVRFELMAVETALLAGGGSPGMAYAFDVQVSTISGRKITLLFGTAYVLLDVTP